MEREHPPFRSLIWFALLALALRPELAAQTPVAFPDPAMEEAVRISLGLDAIDPVSGHYLVAVTDQDLEAAVEIDISGFPVTDPTGIEAASNLRVLYAGSCSLAELGAITALTSLEQLHLSGNPLVRLDGLQNLVRLSVLDLSFTLVSDLGSLRGLPLQTLVMRGVAPASFSPVADLSSLRTLTLSGSSVGSSPGFLSGLSLLRELRLQSCGIERLDALSALTLLEYLDVSQNAVTDLNPLGGLTALRTLSAAQNQIERIPDFSALGSLDFLSLSGNPVTTGLEGLAGLPNLRSLDLNACPVADLAPLPFLSGLQILSLNNASLTALPPMRERVPNLQWLDLSANPLGDAIAALAGLDKLSTLLLTDCSLITLDPLPVLPALEFLSVRNNSLCSLAPLLTQPALGRVDANWNYLDRRNGSATLACVSQLLLDGVVVREAQQWPTQSLESWASANGLPYPIPDNQVTGALGLSPLVAFALGLDPDRSDPRRQPKVQHLTSGPLAQQVEFRFPIAADALGVAVAFEYSRDLRLWSSVEPSRVRIVEDSGDGTQIRQATLDLDGAGPVFVRINVAR